jgi:hypothetical protein
MSTTTTTATRTARQATVWSDDVETRHAARLTMREIGRMEAKAEAKSSDVARAILTYATAHSFTVTTATVSDAIHRYMVTPDSKPLQRTIGGKGAQVTTPEGHGFNRVRMALTAILKADSDDVAADATVTLGIFSTGPDAQRVTVSADSEIGRVIAEYLRTDAAQRVAAKALSNTGKALSNTGKALSNTGKALSNTGK